MAHRGRWAATWGVCWLMFASTVLNYMDRQTVSLLGDPDQSRRSGSRPTPISAGCSRRSSMTYALFQVPAGYLVDRWDLRWTYAAAVAWWSLAAVATALVARAWAC